METISIIGAGGMAAAIGGLATKAGHAVEVISRDPAKAQALVDRIGTGATAGSCITFLACKCGSPAKQRRISTEGSLANTGGRSVRVDQAQRPSIDAGSRQDQCPHSRDAQDRRKLSGQGHNQDNGQPG